ncbi:MAG: TonB-dependent receptor [Ginsengibacter sp.]
MKKITFYISLFLLALGSFSNAVAQNLNAGRAKFSGKITDAKNGELLPGASVYFSDLKTSAVSLNDGTFIINNIPKGRHLIEISYVGHKSIIEYIDITGVQTKDYALSPSILENEEIVVTGFVSGTQIKNAAIPITVVKKEDIFRGASTNIIDAISKQPGISQLTTGPAISKPYIRGLGYNRVLTMSNGIRQEGQQWGDEHGIEVDDYNVDRVEILKGPASLMYGSDGLAGVINIISNTPVPQGTVKGNINSNYQTNDGLYAFNGNLAGNINGFNWNVYGTYKAAHDYKNKYDSYVFNSKFNNTNYGATVGLNKSWGYSHLTYSNFDEKLGLVEGERDETTGQFLKIASVDINGDDVTAIASDKDFKSYNPFIPSQRITHQKFVFDNIFYLPNNGGHFSVTAGWQLSQRKEFPGFAEPDIPGLYFHLKTFTYDVKYFLPSHNKWQTAIGVSGMQQENKNLGVEFLIPAYTLFDIGGFIYTRKTFDKLSISAGARFDNRKINSKFFEEDGNEKFAAFDKSFGSVSASLGGTYDISNNVTAKLNVSKGFRAPNIAELSANGVHEGTIKYEYGNTGLKSETSLQVDGGVEVNTDHVTFSGSLFYNHIQNYIFSRKLNSVLGGDSIPVIANDAGFSSFKYFQINANLYGAEFMLDIHPHPLDWLHFRNTVSYVRGKSAYKTDSTENLPNIPPLRWIPELQANFKNDGKLFKNVYLKFDADFTSKQDNVFSAYQTETSTSGYPLLNAGIGGDIVNNKKQTLFSLSFSANNITDVAYQNHLSRLKYAAENTVTGRMGVYNIGRNFSMKINIPFIVQRKLIE